MVLILVAGAAGRPAAAQEPALAFGRYRVDVWVVGNRLPVQWGSGTAETPDGYLWFHGPDGLVRFDGVRFTTFAAVNQPVFRGAPDDRLVPELVDRRGVLWISTGGGLVSYGDGAFDAGPVLESAAAGETITDLAQTDAGGLLVLTSIGRLFEVDGARLVPWAAAPMAGGRAAGLAVDAAGDVWVAFRAMGNAGGLLRLRGKASTQFTARDGLADDDVRCVHVARDGALWVGTATGVSGMKNGAWARLAVRAGAGGGAPVVAIVDEPDGTVWAASLGGGLLRYERGALSRFARRDGLASDSVLGVFVDREANIWAATDYGLNRLRPVVATTGTRGLDTVPPVVHIEQVAVDGAVLPVSTDGAELAVGAGARRLDIRYTGISLRDGDRVRFRYRLDGLHPTWVDADTARVATYGRLAPGHYQFRVVARNADGIWSPREAVVVFRVLPPFYRTGWFLAACVGAVGLVGWVVQRDAAPGVFRWSSSTRVTWSPSRSPMTGAGLRSRRTPARMKDTGGCSGCVSARRR